MKQVFKVQVPLATNEPAPKALVYNRDRSVQAVVAIDDHLLYMMKGVLRRRGAGRADRDLGRGGGAAVVIG